jgi:hypothetical protein
LGRPLRSASSRAVSRSGDVVASKKLDRDVDARWCDPIGDVGDDVGRLADGARPIALDLKVMGAEGGRQVDGGVEVAQPVQRQRVDLVQDDAVGVEDLPHLVVGSPTAAHGDVVGDVPSDAGKAGRGRRGGPFGQWGAAGQAVVAEHQVGATERGHAGSRSSQRLARPRRMWLRT